MNDPVPSMIESAGNGDDVAAAALHDYQKEQGAQYSLSCIGTEHGVWHRDKPRIRVECARQTTRNTVTGECTVTVYYRCPLCGHIWGTNP